MKQKILLFVLACLFFSASWAQKNATPKWMDKSKNAVVRITTYGKDGAQIATGTGVFVSEAGDVITGYTLFEGANTAKVTDAEGASFPVTHIIGADELYDVIKVRVGVTGKVRYLNMASDPQAVGSISYLLPYTTAKKASSQQGTITEVSKLKDPYSYYKLSLPLEGDKVNTPVLNAEGEVFGLVQADASGKKDISFAVSAAYAGSLSMSPTDFLNSVYNTIGIPKAWPANVEEAQVALFLKNSVEDAKTYLNTLNDFIATFPDAPDGYVSRANHYAVHRAELASSPEEQKEYLKRALDDIETATRHSDKKGEALYNKAKLIYGVAATDTTLNDQTWTLESALEIARKAIAEDNLPAYHQLVGDICFAKKDYEAAYEEYMTINNSPEATSASYYWAAKAKENIPGFNIGDVIVLLDGAIDKCGLPLTAEAGQYILERIDWKLHLSLFAEAVADYDLYYKAMKGSVGSDFFFYREQTKFRAGDMDGALADIREAVRISPDVVDYRAEEASILIRMKNYTDALSSINETLRLAPDYAACHRLKGVCYVRMNKTKEACEALNKAKELGDPLAERLLKEHCK